MTTGIRSDTSGTFGALTFGGDDVLRFGADNSGALQGFRNILINGDMRINQRNVTIAAAANGAYGPDRWKKVDASNMTQIVESGNFEPSTVYTLSGTGITTQQLTSPASGNWTLPNIPITATKIQLEKGSIATPFELRPIGLELVLCQRYYETGKNYLAFTAVVSQTLHQNISFAVAKRIPPTITLSAWEYYSSGVPTASPNPTTYAITNFRFGVLNYSLVNGNGFPGEGIWTASAEL